MRQNEVGTFETVPNTQSLSPKKMRQRNASQKCHDSQNKQRIQENKGTENTAQGPVSDRNQ